MELEFTNCNYSFIRWLIHSHWLIDWLIDWLTDWFIHSFVCLFVPSFIYKCNLFTHGALTFIKNSLKRVRAFQIELEFGNRLVFKERRKPKYPEKNLLEQGREPTTNSTHIWRQRRELNTGHIGGKRVLSPLHHPCSLSLIIHSFIHLFGLLYTSYILLSSDWTKNDKTWVFLGVAETIIGLLLCCGVDIVQCLFNLLYYVIWWLHLKLTKPAGGMTNTGHSTV